MPKESHCLYRIIRRPPPEEDKIVEARNQVGSSLVCAGMTMKSRTFSTVGIGSPWPRLYSLLAATANAATLSVGP